MLFKETKLNGAFIIEPEKLIDQRGFFARTYCLREFEAHGLNPQVVQCNISYNAKKGTLRGLHLQVPPNEEAKLVRCFRGAIYDVIVDLRPESKTYKEHFGVQLNPDNRLMLYVPEGFAHGFITLKDQSEVFYQMSEFYDPDNSRGYRWNDPAFNIKWPEKVNVISEKDRTYPDFE